MIRLLICFVVVGNLVGVFRFRVPIATDGRNDEELDVINFEDGGSIR